MDSTKINQDLTPESADSMLLVWTNDIPKEEIDQESIDVYYGEPKSSELGLVGVYRKKTLLQIDWTLNPENAKQRGFEWRKDVIYDPEAPLELMKSFFDDKENGYEFGEPANTNTIQNGAVGIYRPIKNN